MKLVKDYLGKVSVTTNGEHDSTKSYDRLCIVYVLIDADENLVKSYISKKAVPAGVNIANREYWQPFSVDLGGEFTAEDKAKLDSVEMGATNLHLGITHNQAADGYFANKLNNILWNKYVRVEGDADTDKNENGDSAFQPGIYPNIVRGCPNFIIDGQRKWLGGIWTFFVISGYNKDSDKYHILQFATCNNPDSTDDTYTYNQYVRHITYDSLYTWEGNPDPIFDEWFAINDNNRVVKETLKQFDTDIENILEDLVVTGLDDNKNIRALRSTEDGNGYIELPEVVFSDGGQDFNLSEANYQFDLSDFFISMDSSHGLCITTMPARVDYRGTVMVKYRISNDNLSFYSDELATNSDGKLYVKLASDDNAGVIQLGYTQNNKNYPVVVDSSGKAYVNIPWTETSAFDENGNEHKNPIITSYGTVKFETGGGSLSMVYQPHSNINLINVTPAITKDDVNKTLTLDLSNTSHVQIKTAIEHYFQEHQSFVGLQFIIAYDNNTNIITSVLGYYIKVDNDGNDVQPTLVLRLSYMDYTMTIPYSSYGALTATQMLENQLELTDTDLGIV